MKLTPRVVRVLLIVFTVEGGAMLLAGIVMLAISFVHDIYPVIGLWELLVGLPWLVVGIWLLKRGGKGILGGGTKTAK